MRNSASRLWLVAAPVYRVSGVLTGYVRKRRLPVMATRADVAMAAWLPSIRCDGASSG